MTGKALSGELSGMWSQKIYLRYQSFGMTLNFEITRVDYSVFNWKKCSM